MNPDLHEPLEAGPVRDTVTQLRSRIVARFPHRGLPKVAGDLLILIDEVESSATLINRRIQLARLASRALMVLILAGTLLALALAVRDAARAVVDGQFDSSLDLLPLVETAINDIVFAGIAVFFLWSFPERIQRGQLLNLLHQLRSTAHIIDMHQLTKDPEQLKPTFVPTEASVPLDLDRDQMERYLDYCSELLSLVGKTAALCAEESRDNVILDTVARIETLTAGMSRKIWQKISTLPAPVVDG
ncbi:hypothetical protein [Nocardioides sp. SYSU D00038]|uniref:hypothetical protein n=1 Tax=Nocardioides sp. SYSU D00038 TaxID=2812554 RepID=UPI0027DC93D0|nr:hypothetical protein [Nocardioides sp. SYSU D00038]